MPNSGTVASGQQATAAQYNNLRSDVLDPASGHTHDGASGLGFGLWTGDGSDGDVTITGGTTTLARDMFYNSLTITGTGVLATNGWRVFVKGTLSIATGGVMSCDGPSAAGSLGGAWAAGGGPHTGKNGANGKNRGTTSGQGPGVQGTAGNWGGAGGTTPASGTNAGASGGTANDVPPPTPEVITGIQWTPSATEILSLIHI